MPVKSSMGSGTLIANAGTPLMWASCFMLLFGNLLIAQLEHWLIVGKRPSGFVWSPMIPGNYLSMFGGIAILYLAAPLFEPAFRDPFRNGLYIVIGAWLAAFVITVLIELPFIAMTAGKKMGMQSLKTGIRVHLISYSILILAVHLLGSVSALTGLQQVELSKTNTDSGWLYYLSEAGNAIYRTRLDGMTTEFVKNCEPISDSAPFARVTVEPTETGGRARLLYRESASYTVIEDNLGSASQAAPAGSYLPDGSASLGNLTSGPSSVRRFRKEPPVYVGFWPREGLVIDGSRYALETPFLSVPWTSAVVLPDGKVIAQFGGAIYLVDSKAGVVALLARGSGGDVLLDPE